MIYTISKSLNIVFQIIAKSSGESDSNKYIKSILIQSVFILLAIALFKFGPRFKHCVDYIPNISCIIYIISVFEDAITSEMQVSIALIASLSTISYNQKNLMITLALCSLYSLLRTYFLYRSGDLLLYFKFNISLNLSLALIVIFSRAVH